jgi:hypothetical protein
MRILGSSARSWAIAAAAMLPILGGSSAAGNSDSKTPANSESTKETPKADSRPVVDAAKVYLGQAATCKAPSVVDADRVYRAIPEYKRIVEKKLTEKDAEYSLLLLKATKKFRAAVEAAAADGSYDLVAAVGAVKWEGHTVPDLTDAAVRKIPDSVK